MGSATYIGRVGALAVALGVGIALGNPVGIAVADDGAAPSVNSPDSPSTPGAPPTGTRHPQAGDKHFGYPARADTPDSGGKHRRHSGDTSRTGDGTDTDNSSSTTEHQPKHRQRHTAPDPKPTANAAAPPTNSTVDDQPPAPPKLVDHKPMRTPTPHTSAANPPASPAPAAAVAAIAPPAIHPLTAVENAPSTTQFSVQDVSPVVTTTSPATTNPIGALLAIPGTIVTTVMNVLKPFLAPGGDVPANPPLAWAVLAWVRRQFINDPPQVTGAPMLTPNANGTTTIDINATDPDGDHLTYTAGGATHGTITVDPTGDADGSTFTYTPNAGYVGSDTVTLTATDAGNGFHLIDLFSGGGRSTATTVTVAPTQPPQVDPLHSYGIDASLPTDPAGTVRGHLNASGATGFSGPPNTDRGTLTVNPDGTFVYHPTDQARHDAAADGAGVVTDTFAVTAANHAGSVDVPVTVVITSYNAAPVAPANPGAQLVEHTDGLVTGNLGIADADGDTLTYTATDPMHGTVTIDANGNYTYTPTGQARLDAYSASSAAPTPLARFAAFSLAAVPSPTTDSFTVTATDSHGGSTSSVINVPVDPISAAVINKVTVPGSDYNVNTGRDGTMVFSKAMGSGTAADPYQTNIVVVHPDGSTSQGTYAGNPFLDIQVGADGTTAYTARLGAGTVTDPYQTNLVVIHPNGTTTSQTTSGINSGTAQVGANGTTASVSTVGGGGQTTVTIIRPDGNVVTKVINQTPPPHDNVAVGADGTTAVTTYVSNGMGAYQTTLTVIRPDGTTKTVNTPGIPNGSVQVSDNGTALDTVYTGNGTAANPYQSTVTVVASDGTTTTQSAPGLITAHMGADGTAAFTSQTGGGTVADPYQSTLTVIHPNGTTDIHTTTGSAYGPVLLGANGTAVSTTYTGTGVVDDPSTTTITAITPSGTVVTKTTAGTPYDTRVSANGTIAYVTSDDGVHLTVIRPDGTTATSTAIPTGFIDFQVGDDGTTAYANQTGSGTTQDPSRTTFTIIGTDGAITSRTANGQWWATFVGADGTVYAAANPETNDGMNVVITRPSGATTTTTILGAANGTMVAPDGKTYVTSWAAGSYTVTTIGIANDAGQPPHVDPVNPYTTDPAQAGDPAGTVRGHINSPQGSGWTFTGPVTTAHGTLTVSPDGSYVYTPTDEARHLAATEGSGPLTDTFAISVANANGSTDVQVTVPVGPPLNAVPHAPVTPPAALTDHTNGQVSSGLGWMDGDGDTLTYSGPAGGTTSRGGTVVVNPDGTYTYTPSVQARLDAYSTPGADTDTFNITVSDGHGGHITTPVTVTIDPAGAAIMHSTAVSGTIVNTKFGADGTTAVTTRTGTGTTADPILTTATAIHPDGTTTSKTITGTAIGTVEVGAHGTTALVTRAGSGTSSDPYRYTITTIDPDGTTTSNTITGTTPTTPRIGADGTTALVTRAGSGTSSDPYRYTITTIHPDGTTTSKTITGTTQLIADSANGTTIAARAGTGTTTDPYRTTVTTVHPDGTTTSSTVTGSPNASAQVGPDGTAALITYTGTGTTNDPFRYSLTTIRPDGTITSKTVTGSQYDPRIGADGTATVATRIGVGTVANPPKTTVTAVHPNGTTTSTTITGTLDGNSQVGADGTIAVFTHTGTGTTTDPYQYAVTVIHPDGTTTSNIIAGSQYADPQVGANGTTTITTRAGYGTTTDPYRTIVMTVHPDGTTTSNTITGLPSDIKVAADGTTTLATYNYGATVTTVTTIRPNGTTASNTIAGVPAGTEVAADGTAYELVRSPSGDTQVLVIRRSGETTTTTVTGAPQGLAIAVDGTVCVTTKSNTNGDYIVTAIKVAPEPT